MCSDMVKDCCSHECVKMFHWGRRTRHRWPVSSGSACMFDSSTLVRTSRRTTIWDVLCTDFALPTSYYWKASNNYTVDLSEVTYRVYGPDVVNPPSKELINAAETVMKAMYEKFCNITAHITESTDSPSATIIMHRYSTCPSLLQD